MHHPDPAVAFAFFVGALVAAAARDGGVLLGRVLFWWCRR
jgi:hypothetical protein